MLGLRKDLCNCRSKLVHILIQLLCTEESMSLSIAMPQTPQLCLMAENNPACRPVLWICLLFISPIYLRSSLKSKWEEQFMFTPFSLGLWSKLTPLTGNRRKLMFDSLFPLCKKGDKVLFLLWRHCFCQRSPVMLWQHNLAYLVVEENEMPAPSAQEAGSQAQGGWGLLQPSSQVTTPCKPSHVLNYTLNQLILWSSCLWESSTEFNCSDSIKTFLPPN